MMVSSKKWGNITENRQGKALSRALLYTDLDILNDGRPTRLATRARDTDGVIDLALVSSAAFSELRWNVLEPQESDHLPCAVLVAKGITAKKQARPKRPFNYLYHGNINHDDPLKKLRQNVRSGTTRTSFIQPPWWNNTLETAWQEKRIATSEWQKARKKRPINNDDIEEKNRVRHNTTNK